jgi:hypothetical protein
MLVTKPLLKIGSVNKAGTLGLADILRIKVANKTVTENWVIEAPSVGTILAYLETTA